MIKPSKVIGENYLSRWHVIPKNPLFNIFLHRFVGSDDDRATHDHPWKSWSILLSGDLSEVFKYHFYPDNPMVHGGYYCELKRSIKRFKMVSREAEFAHRLILEGDKPAWTIFITGPRIRKDWYFWCKKGPVHYSLMTTPDGKQIGGCE